jgi:hypothetical protein
MADKQAFINKAKAEMPRVSRPAPAKGGPGPEKKYSGSAFKSAGPRDAAALGRAVNELYDQHPKKHDDLGPHRGGSTHERHEALGGLHSKGSHGR